MQGSYAPNTDKQTTYVKKCMYQPILREIIREEIMLTTSNSPRGGGSFRNARPWPLQRRLQLR